ncbi:MAG TPA: S9 family peptidase [Candidatus Sulfotelmatobacter sp.]|nr:S9 family peptidase [Candidatus Sulfotelmatobacter sp.]
MSEPLDFDRFVRLPRLSSLRLSPDGARLVVTVAQPHASGTKMASALWAVDPEGSVPPRRLTRSAAGEGSAAFGPDGSLVFGSARPDPDAKEAEPDPPAALWHLPAGGGEARLLVVPHGGVDGTATARRGRRVAFVAPLFGGAESLEADAARAKSRKDAGLEALLFEGYPIRLWDHYLGPRERHAFVLDLPASEADPVPAPRDLLPALGQQLEDRAVALTPDGATAVLGLGGQGIGRPKVDLVAVDTTTLDQRVLTPGDALYDQAAVSPDGRSVACVRADLGAPDRAESHSLWLIDLASGGGHDPAPGIDLWPDGLAWSADGKALFFVADRQGHQAAFRLDLDGGRLTCLAATGTLSDLCPSPDGHWVYALRSTLRVPNEVVRLDARAPEQEPVVIPSPAATEAQVAAPGAVERITGTAADGTPIGAWLVKPEGMSAAHPAPLVVFVHGGPLGTWTDGWHWRWNPQLLAARGYAVVMPDPAISLGYGQAFVQRGWGEWGAAPYTDMLAAVDAAAARPDVDASRMALMGGSFGGYMANWVAGHTDRFKAIVTHASLWELRGFHGTTDNGAWWELEMGDPYVDGRRYEEHSPAAHVASIRTPMLVIHGELDARVPISEALRLWTDLQRHGVAARFLYFPDENHWVLKPQNARVWYATVLAFLEEQLRGVPFERPALV